MFKRIAQFAFAACAVVAGPNMPTQAQAREDIRIALIAPLSGLYGRTGEVMRMGAELGVEHINAQGGIKALGGAKLKLVIYDTADSTEKAKNAAQRMVAQDPDLVAGTGAFLSSFTLAVTEVTERAQLPMLTLSFSDLIGNRGFKYVFQTSPTAGTQVATALPEVLKLAESSSGSRPKTIALVGDNTATSIATAKMVREKLVDQLGLKVVLDETWTPPLADATQLVQKLRASRPELLLFLPTADSDAKLFLDKINEFGLGQGRIPILSFSISIIDPVMLNSMNQDLLQGLMAVVGNWGFKGHEKLESEIKAKYKEPWLTQNAISTYGDMWIIKEALESAGKADKQAVAEALRAMDLRSGPTQYFPGGRIKFDDSGRRVGAGLTIVQWQNGKSVTVYPDDIAVAKPIWFKN